MPIGLIIDCSGVFIGGLIGSRLKRFLKKDFTETMTMICGFFSMAIGIRSIVGTNDMTAPVLAIILAFILGYAVNLEKNIQHGVLSVFKKIRIGGAGMDMSLFCTSVSLFCCSAVGWYGSMLESVSGEHTILFTKAIMDSVTAAILAASLGGSVSLIAVFQFVIFLCFFIFGHVIQPLCSPEMILDFSACGGLIAFANGFRMAKLKELPVLNLMPALLIILPLSALWRQLAG